MVCFPADWRQRSMLRKAHQSMWSILSLLISYAILLRVWSTQVYFDRIFAWFHWFELPWLYLDMSRPQLNVSFTYRLVNKLQKILETNSMISRKPQNLFWSWKQAHQSWRHKYWLLILCSNFHCWILIRIGRQFRPVQFADGELADNFRLVPNCTCSYRRKTMAWQSRNL